MQFNEQSESRAEKTRSTNKAGGESFDPDSAELSLTKVVINNLLEDSYYESAEAQLQAVEDEFNAVAETNPEFALKLAKYARQEENLRQIPQALFVLSVEDERTRDFAEDYARGIMSRTDEPLDVLAFYVSRNGKSLPGALTRSIESAMHQWNEWQYAKWDQPNKEWQYRDLLNLVHPKPRDEQREDIFEKIALGDLDDYDVESLTQQDTWESSLSDDSDDRSKEEKYREQLEEGNMGLFPRIRQARDMLSAGVAADRIFDEVSDEWVRNSRLYPFRFYQGYKAVRDSTGIPSGEQRKATEYLEGFMRTATENLPEILDDTFAAVDISGSMRSSVSNDSSLQCDEISTLFGALVYERGASVAAFASDIQEFHGDRRNPITTNMDDIRGLSVGGSTNGYLIPKALREFGRKPSQVIVFTDMQLWNDRAFGSSTTFRNEWNKYKQEVNPDVSLYLVDLQSYSDLVVPEEADGVHQLQGWSSNIVDYIDNMENIETMVSEIESTQPDE